MYKRGDSYGYSYRISSHGGITWPSYTCGTGYNVRPTLYLSPDVYRVSGTGTITDPYIIGMAS